MDRGTTLKLGIAAAVFGAMFMVLWMLGGILVHSLREAGGPPVASSDEPGHDFPPGKGVSRPLHAALRDAGLRSPAHPPEEIESLISGLSADDYAMRRSAEDALVKMGEKAVPGLERAVKSEDPETSWRAAEAIRRIASGER